MPEGDTILRLAANINARFKGDRVESSVFRHPRLATLDLTGRTLVDATSHGKHLFVNFDDETSLHIHLLMQGHITFDRRSTVEDWRRRFELDFAVGHMAGIDIPLLHHVDTADSERFTGHLGPDLCGTLDLEAAGDRLATAEADPLGAALLDQKHIAGFGNIYAVEVPFICGLSPFTPVGEIEGLDQLVAIGAALIRTNASLGPQNTTGRKLNTSDRWILDSPRRDCGLCGEPIRTADGSTSPWRRRTAWCEVCQARSHTRVDLVRARRLLSLHPAHRSLDFEAEELFVGSTEPVVVRGSHDSRPESGSSRYGR